MFLSIWQAQMMQFKMRQEIIVILFQNWDNMGNEISPQFIFVDITAADSIFRRAFKPLIAIVGTLADF